jgi:hypothetical protein
MTITATILAITATLASATKFSSLAGRILPNRVNEAAAVPKIPDQFYAEIHGNTTGNLSGVPYGVSVVKQWYDYTNKRLRKDFDDGTTKMYDYKTLVDPGMEKKPAFPSPQGFKFNTNDIENTCCWLWLLDSDTGNAETMDKFQVEDNAKDLGPDGVKGEHWLSVKTFPFYQTDDWWFKKGVLSSSNSYFNIPGKSSVSGYVMSNATFQNVSYGPASVPAEVFAHPDSRPTFGKCKQCGVDDACPMWQCMQ